MYAVDTTLLENDLKEVRTLLNNAIKPYSLKNGNTRIGLVKYDVKSENIVNFPGIDKDGFSLATEFLEHAPGTRNIAQAFDYTKTSFFEQKDPRRNSRKLIVLFVNGKQAINNMAAVESSLKSLNESNIGYVIVHLGDLGSSAVWANSFGKYGKVIHSIRSSALPEALRFIIHAGEQKEGMLIRLLRYFEFVCASNFGKMLFYFIELDHYLQLKFDCVKRLHTYIPGS